MNVFVKLWYAIVGEPSVAKAVTKVETVLAKLEKAVTHQSEKAVIAAKIAEDAAKAKAFAEAEAEKAKRVLGKLADLLA